jgi:DNA-binding CsgD family transcriptional regulator
MRDPLVFLLDAAVRECPDADAWASGVLDASRGSIDEGLGVVARVVRRTQHDLDVLWTKGSNPTIARLASEWLETARALGAYPHMLEAHRRACTLIGGGEVGERHPELTRLMAKGGAADLLGVFVADGEADAFQLLSPLRSRVALTRRQVANVKRLGVHVTAGYRAIGKGVAAVFSVTGDVLHADDGAKEARTLAVLREHVTRIDRARARALRGKEAFSDLLEVWQGLVDGELTLLDRIDTDGKRLVVAKRNAPKVAAPLPLDARESQVVMLAGQGYTTANISYVLGVSPGLVTTLVDGALPKLGLTSRAGLAPLIEEWLAPSPKPPARKPKKK